MPVDHYENFPVASYALPARLRRPVAAIYAFARAADDIADEGNATPEARIAALNNFERTLDEIAQGQSPTSRTSENEQFSELAWAIRNWRLPVQPFRDLLDAFRQDAVKTRYANYGEVMDYCRRSANPVGRLMMVLFEDDDPRHLAYSDALCASLQQINFLQDVAIDLRKGRIYLPQDELVKAGLSDTLLARLIGEKLAESPVASAPRMLIGIPVISRVSTPEDRWRQFMAGQIKRLRNMLQAAAPLGLVLKGRAGFETRMIIAGGDRILRKLHVDPLAPLKHRVKLNAWDWLMMFLRALFKK